MNGSTLGIIGCGNMGLTYARSFLQFNLVTRENLLLVARDKHHARELRKTVYCLRMLVAELATREFECFDK